MKQIGYILSGCDQSKVSFVVMEDAKVYVNNYYFINHPSSPAGEFNPVLLRVYKITPYNPEMTIGSFGPIAGKKGERAYYGKKLEYLVAWAEVLGYISWDGKWRRLECSPNTWDSVYEPTYEELEGFFIKLSSKSLTDRTDFPITIGRHRGLNIPFYLDLNAIAKGHMFVAGMSVEYGEPFIYMIDGRIRIERIGEFVDRFFEEDSEGSIPVEGIYVPSFNPKTYRVDWRPVVEVIRHSYTGPLIRITTETGKTVTVTPDHSVFVLRNGEVTTIPASDIHIGDYLITPSRIPPNPKPITEIDVIEFLGSSEDRGSIYLHNVPEGVYERFDRDHLWCEGDRKFSLRWRRRRILPVRYAKLLTSSEKANVKIAAKNGAAIPAVIKLDEDIARLIGYYVAGGSIEVVGGRRYNVVFNLNDLNVVEDIRSIIGRLTVDAKIDVLRSSLGYRVVVSSRVLTLLLKNITPDDVESRRIPWIILNAKPNVKLEFLKALSTCGSSITSYRWLFSDVQYLLSTLDVSTACLTVPYGLEIQNLMSNSDQTAVEYSSLPTSDVDCKSLEDIAVKPFKGDLKLLRVVQIETVESEHKYVYDLSIPGCENFLAGFGGVFCHNTRSGKSTFVLNLIARALENDLKPRFIIFDRRCEYSLLTKYGAVVFPYFSFIPKTELISPTLIASKLGLDPNKAEGKLLCEALNSIKADCSDLTVRNVLKRCVELSPYLVSRGRDSILSKIRWVLEKRGDAIFTEDHKPLNIIETLYNNPSLIVDFSVDANIEDQQLTAKYLIREVVNHAIKCRSTGDFATIFVIEEAQYFIPERGLKIEVGNPEKTGVDKQIIEAISQAGGYNVGFIIVTQRPAYISKSTISQCNTIAAFRLMAGNDQEAIIKYSEYGSERMSDYLPGLADHEALIWGMASPVPFPVTVEIDVKDYPSKTGVTAKVSWERMKIKSSNIKIQQ